MAPFTPKQVENINKYQACDWAHPFTCCSSTSSGERCDRLAQPNEGALMAAVDGLICPCGKYTQFWVHSFMASGDLPEKPTFDFLNS